MEKDLVRVYQIYFHKRQLPFLSSEFTPYLNLENDGFYEAGVFRREFDKNTHLKQPYTGFVSWRFEKKSFVPASEFLKLAQECPGQDVYFLNPFPELCLRYKNVWLQGGESHPGLLELSQKIFDHVGTKLKLGDLVTDSDNTLYCNYWYGSQRFWKDYITFCMPFYELFQDVKSPFYQDIRSGAHYHGGGTLIPFFMERLFSTFLAMNPDIARFAYAWSPERLGRMQERMRHQLNVSEAKLDEILQDEENRPHWKRFLRRRL